MLANSSALRILATWFFFTVVIPVYVHYTYCERHCENKGEKMIWWVFFLVAIVVFQFWAYSVLNDALGLVSK